MTKQEQKATVQLIAQEVTRSLLDNIEEGKIPPTWDGIELRRLFTERTTLRDYHCLSGQRAKDYRETVSRNSLYLFR